jgi:hypothetical protein
MIVLIVQDVVAPIGSQGQHSMTLAFLIAYYGDEQRPPGPAGLDQQPPLEQDVVFTVSIAIIGIGPAFCHPQCSKSVSGLIVALTSLLTRTRSLQCLGVITNSCTVINMPPHSSGSRVQKSIHPIGGGVTFATGRWLSCLGSAVAGKACVEHAASAAINTALNLALKTLKLTA